MKNQLFHDGIPTEELTTFAWEHSRRRAYAERNQAIGDFFRWMFSRKNADRSRSDNSHIGENQTNVSLPVGAGS